MNKRMIFMALLMLTAGSAVAGGENVKFSGTLVALPCTIPDSDRPIRVPMGNINAHDLYLHQAMPRIPFILHLQDCDTQIAGRVSVTFSGVEDAALPGYLAVDGGQSEASGIGIGLENSNGEQIKVNQATASYALLSGNNELGFQAFIAGEPEAVKERSIQTGNFSAAAILEVSYE
ncbi:fimbrial protein (plasmid) [Pantoea agglomerans]|uniref:fimbrial protein n=1 Tax=Enterobacter agglomerans TaxID=549 RepID=UPI001FCF02E8|nr:fimbrial protein [Pantoea agglomerans]WVL92458.1 fimbrial protein [Pantoea agglomerans]